MNHDIEELYRCLARLSEEVRHSKNPEEHPSPEELSAYQANELSPEGVDEIQEHLIQCTLCTDLFLELGRFLNLSEEDFAQEGVSDLGTEVGMRRLREEIEEWRNLSAVEQSGQRRSLRAFQALAATLLVGLTGLTVQAVRLQEDLEFSLSVPFATSLREESKSQEVYIPLCGPYLTSRLVDRNESSYQYGQSPALSRDT